MMQVVHLIRRVKNLVEAYSFGQPFSLYLKEHFRKHPEMGARDRRETREWSMSYFRIGNSLLELSFEERLAIGCFLCNEIATPSLTFLLENHSSLKPGEMHESVDEKIKMVEASHPQFNTNDIFQMGQHLSPEINFGKWGGSFLKKPRVWIRIKSPHRKKVIDEFQTLSISFEVDENESTLSFKPETPLDKTQSFRDGLFEIQDRSSQRVREFLEPGNGESWWDACAGSGGKSLLILEKQPSVKLFATDVRKSILDNYSERLKKSGHRNFEAVVCDLSVKNPLSLNKNFDGIVADVPCSGSGTWARSPERLVKDISTEINKHFVPLQRSIVSNVLPSLKAGSPFVFITCSVFKEENEENVRYFLDHFPLALEKTAYLEGFESGSDTLFVARFSKES